MDSLKAFNRLFDSRLYPCIQPLASRTEAKDVEYFVVIDGVRYVFNRSDKFTGVRYGLPRWANGPLTTGLNLIKTAAASKGVNLGTSFCWWRGLYNFNILQTENLGL
jgi:hypothetical protein